MQRLDAGRHGSDRPSDVLPGGQLILGPLGLGLPLAVLDPNGSDADWGVAGLSGGLIGPPGTPRDYVGSLDGTPVFLGCSDVDAHIPAARVRETADTFTRLGAVVTLRLYAGMGHTINDEEMQAVRAMVVDAVAT